MRASPPPRSARPRRRWPLRRWRVSPCALLALLALARPGIALEIDDVFPLLDRSDPPRRVSAEELVSAAFRNLFVLDVAVAVESTRITPEGEDRTTFRVYRKSFEPATQRILIARSSPSDPDKELRMLEVISGRDRMRASVFSPEIDADPMTTSYRLTDPFLGTFSDKPPEEVRADLSALVRGHEIIARQPGTLGSEAVHRVTLRPLGARRLERVELFIARDAPVILEYRYFEGNDPVPARVAQAPREGMRSFGGRLLPGRMIYRDRLDQSETRLDLRYQSLPSELGDAPFMDSSFYRAPLPK